MAKATHQLFELGGHEVKLSNPEKVYFPKAGITKLDLVEYYLSVESGVLRALARRPMILKRYVNGAEGEPFYQKRAPAKRPPWLGIATFKFPSGRSADEIVVNNAASLVYCVSLGCIELHPHAVRSEDMDRPDELRIDLDPVPGVTWPQIIDVAKVAREVLAEVGLVGWPKTSGSRGAHLWVRIEQKWPFTTVRRAALAFAREVERRAPTIATAKWWKEERTGVFLDYNQNARDRTTCCAYSVRARDDAPVPVPLSSDHLPDPHPRSPPWQQTPTPPFRSRCRRGRATANRKQEQRRPQRAATGGAGDVNSMTLAGRWQYWRGQWGCVIWKRAARDPVLSKLGEELGHVAPVARLPGGGEGAGDAPKGDAE